MAGRLQPWKPGDATKIINQIACDLTCDLSCTRHAKEQLHARSLIMSDLLFVLRKGFVYEEPKASTVKELYKYQIEGQSPNSGSRHLRVVVVPDAESCQLKIITIMWRDEK